MAEISKFWKLQKQILRLRLEQMELITKRGEEYDDFIEEIKKRLELGEGSQELLLRVKFKGERQELHIEQTKKLKKRIKDDFEDMGIEFG